MSTFEKLFGDQLLNKSRAAQKTSELLADKDVVGLYFSAHWCGPCRAFTPQLAAIYKKLTEVQNKKFEIIFVSSDQNDEQFLDYAKDMPWLCLPYSERDRKKALSKKFKVDGIPTLVLLDKDGKTITTDGREALTSNPEGFPWTPKTFHEIMSDTTKLLKDGGEATTFQSVKGKVVGFYFSAHWCPPCKAFTPQFVETYNKVQENNPNKFEVIFVSSDRSEDSFNGYFSTMPWLALPLSDTDTRGELSSLYGVSGIPCLVIVDTETGKIINQNGRGAIANDKAGTNFPWVPALVNELSGDGVNDYPCLILFGVYSKQLEDEYIAIAKQVKASKTDDEDDILFFMASDEADGISSQIRKICSFPVAEKRAAQLLLLDIPEGGFYTLDGEVNRQSIESFVQDYRGKKLTIKQLSK